MKYPTNLKSTLEKLNKEYGSPKDINIVHKHKMNSLDKLAIFTTQRVGTMGFFFIIFSWTFIWLSWNIFAPIQMRFDPFPAFVFWLFISNLIQLHLMPLIMIGQNLQGRHAEIRAQHDYEVNTKAEKEIELILLHLAQQQELILKILQKIEKLEKSKTN
ncbi:DUF1003 domain-containing protein [Candidatus Gottesmanbacteria bacterium]|nr:DUF1003 domain-containing protein [Candidatus Gottesmanbacteria bacterium]